MDSFKAGLLVCCKLGMPDSIDATSQLRYFCLIREAYKLRNLYLRVRFRTLPIVFYFCSIQVSRSEKPPGTLLSGNNAGISGPAKKNSLAAKKKLDSQSPTSEF